MSTRAHEKRAPLLINFYRKREGFLLCKKSSLFHVFANIHRSSNPVCRQAGKRSEVERHISILTYYPINILTYYLSTSPSTISIDPNIATISEIIAPFAISGNTDKLENEPERALQRIGRSVFPSVTKK